MNAGLSPTSLSKQTFFLGIKLWVLVLALASLLTFLILIAALLCIFSRRRRSQHLIPCRHGFAASSLDRRLLSQRIIDVEMMTNNAKQHAEYSSNRRQDCAIPVPGDLESVSRRNGRKEGSGFALSWSEIEMATGGFADHNVIGRREGVTVYLGVLLNNARVAITRLPWKSCEDEEMFMAEMDVIGHIRHRNLVQLLGYCIEGEDQRAIVNEYVENGNLHQWLHECPKEASPLNWDQRMNILQGIAKGLAYLHEDLEPKLVHGHLNSTSILLDRQWNPKISDLCTSKLLGQEPHSTEQSDDVYSFGVLVMEMVSGRTPAKSNHSQQPQVGCLIEWLKSMVAEGKVMLVADPKLKQMPCSKDLKRMLLVALRCVDAETSCKLTMGEVVRMLEPGGLLLARDLEMVQSVESLGEEQSGSVSESSASEQ